MIRSLITLALISMVAFAREQTLSPIAPPTQSVLNISIDTCKESCLNKLLKDKAYFSFIAAYQDNPNKNFIAQFKELLTLIDTPIFIGEGDFSDRVSSRTLKIALMIPQKSIGRYSATSADSIVSYLIARGIDFEFSTFDTQNEDLKNLQATYLSIQEQDYDCIIAILTANGLSKLLDAVSIDTPLFVPTVNRKQVKTNNISDNVFFGGIDYDKQMNMIIKIADAKNASIIGLNDDGVVGKLLGEMLNIKSKDIAFQDTIDKKNATDFRDIFRKIRPNIKNSMIILNTSVVKSGLIIPQIGNTRIMPMAFLSTQVNFNPSLISLMPQEDAKKLFIVSVINPVNPKLLSISELMSANFRYDWVNYSTALCVDIFLSIDRRVQDRFFNEVLQYDQIMFADRFYGIKDYHFIPVTLR